MYLVLGSIIVNAITILIFHYYINIQKVTPNVVQAKDLHF